MIDKRLRVLQLLAQHGTVTAVAQALNYTPPAVSHQLKQLSTDLGVELVVRDGRRLRLTEQARVLLRHAEKMFAQAEEARAEITSTAYGGSLTLCGFSSAVLLLPQVVSDLSEQHPQLQVRLIQTTPTACLNLLLTEEADLALLPATADLPAPSDSRFEQHLLANDPLDLLVPASHPFASCTSVSLADAAGESWIVGHPEGPYHPLMISACLAAGFSPDIAHVIEDWDVTYALVSRGKGVTLIPRMLPMSTHWRTARVPLHGQSAPSRQLLSVIRRGSQHRPLITSALAAIRAGLTS